jgi:hypothetical protein
MWCLVLLKDGKISFIVYLETIENHKLIIGAVVSEFAKKNTTSPCPQNNEVHDRH